MKYGSTSKNLCLIFHGIISVAFLALGLYFGIFVVPFYFTTIPDAFTASLFNASFYLYLELAVAGFVLFFISGHGFLKAVKSLTINGQESDKLVVSSFSDFISEGWIVGLTLFLNGAVLFDIMSSGGNIAFPIVMCVLIAIIVFIATNIPTMRIFDGHDYRVLTRSLYRNASILFAVLTIETLLALIGLMTGTVIMQTPYFYTQLLLILVPSAIVFAFTLVSYLTAKKKEGKSSKLSSALTVSGVLLLGSAILVLGVLDLVWGADIPCHLVALKQGSSWNFTGYGYGVMSIVIGALTFLGVIVALVFTGRGKKEEKLPKA